VELFLINRDGSGEQRLTRNNAVGYLSDFTPPPALTWAPDGDRIAFDNHGGEEPTVLVVRADGTGQQIVARDALYPAWSPTDDLIAFTRIRGDAADIWGVRSDGTDAHILVRDAAFAAWSPDGHELVFVRLSGDDTDLYIASLDDGTERPLTTGSDADLLPAWAPADRIAFVRYVENAEIFVIDPNGTGERRLTHDLAEDTSPAWSPSGSHIAFTNDLTFTKEWRAGEEIFVMDADGNGRTRLTHNTVRDVALAWEPG
jgi:Tol biopolymer transport system component